MMQNGKSNPSACEAYIWGCVLLLIPFLSWLFSSMAFAVGSTIACWIFPAACLSALAYGHIQISRTSPHPAGPLLRYYAAISATLLFAVLSAASFYDNSTDGNIYHQDTVIALLDGWNPFAGSDSIGSIWIRHYAKAIEIVAATITACTGRLEAGKAVNVILALSAGFTAYSFLREEFRKQSTTKIVLLTLLLTLSPTVLRQLYVYYIDYAMYCFMLLTVLSLIRIYRGADNKAWTIIVTATLFATGTKFNIAFYQYLTLAVSIIWFYLARKQALACKLAVISLLMLAGGMCLLAYHPYITNLTGWGNPFYPLIGSSIDIMAGNTPELYTEGNRFSNLIRSLFYTYDGRAVWIPFITGSLRDYVIGFDRRIAGFGPFFIYIYIGAAALLACCRQSVGKTQLRVCTAMSILLSAACFAFEQSWWMRYVPFLWAAPLLLLLCTEYAPRINRRASVLRNALYGLLGLTLLLTAGSTAIGAGGITIRMNRLYKAVTPESAVKIYAGGMPSFLYKLQERGIHYEEIPSEDLCISDSALRRLPLQDEVVFYLDTATYARIKRPDLLDFIMDKKDE